MSRGKLTLIRGVRGAGKSTWRKSVEGEPGALQLTQAYGDVVFGLGSSRCTPEQVGEAVATFEKYLDTLASPAGRIRGIAVEGTFEHLADAVLYVMAALARDYEVRVVEIVASIDNVCARIGEDARPLIEIQAENIARAPFPSWWNVERLENNDVPLADEPGAPESGPNDAPAGDA